MKTCRECRSQFDPPAPQSNYCPDHSGEAAERRRWRKRYPEKQRRQGAIDSRRRLIRSYGLEPRDYDVMLAAQGGMCAICGRPETLRIRGQYLARLAIDHDAGTGRVRGLLCSECNTSLGKFAHDPARLRRAIAYLEQAA